MVMHTYGRWEEVKIDFHLQRCQWLIQKHQPIIIRDSIFFRCNQELYIKPRGVPRWTIQIIGLFKINKPISGHFEIKWPDHHLGEEEPADVPNQQQQILWFSDGAAPVKTTVVVETWAKVQISICRHLL